MTPQKRNLMKMTTLKKKEVDISDDEPDAIFGEDSDGESNGHKCGRASVGDTITDLFITLTYPTLPGSPLHVSLAAGSPIDQIKGQSTKEGENQPIEQLKEQTEEQAREQQEKHTEKHPQELTSKDQVLHPIARQNEQPIGTLQG